MAAGIAVRVAEPRDWDDVAALLAELGRPDVRGTDDEAAARELFVAYLSRDDTVALVAEAEGRITGFVNVEFRSRLNFLRPQAWIPELIVTETDRSRGAGSALLTRAEELSRERGCWGMTLESANWRERAHAFYQREGWNDTGKSFFKNLTGVAWPPAPRP